MSAGSAPGAAGPGRQPDDDFQETASLLAPDAAGPATRPAAAAPPAAPVTRRRLARVEILDRDGRVRHSVAVQEWPVTLGRSLDNTVVLDDPHVAPHHIRIELSAAGRPELLVLPGLNGVVCDGRRGHAGERIGLSAWAEDTADGALREFVAGHTRLRLRLPGEGLEPERPLPVPGRHGTTVLLAVVLWAWILAEHAIGLDPGGRILDWLPPLVGAPAALAAWCLLWALASKLFQHRFEFWPHVAVVVRGLLVIELISFILPWLSGVSGWPDFSRLTTGVGAAIGVLLLLAHARLVLPQQRRALALAAAAAYVAGAGILLTLNQQRHERWFSELYSAALPPPALNWAAPVTRQSFVAEAAKLRPALQRSVTEAAAEQKDLAGSDDD